MQELVTHRRGVESPHLLFVWVLKKLFYFKSIIVDKEKDEIIK